MLYTLFEIMIVNYVLIKSFELNIFIKFLDQNDMKISNKKHILTKY